MKKRRRKKIITTTIIVVNIRINVWIPTLSVLVNLYMSSLIRWLTLVRLWRLYRTHSTHYALRTTMNYVRVPIYNSIVTYIFGVYTHSVRTVSIDFMAVPCCNTIFRMNLWPIFFRSSNGFRSFMLFISIKITFLMWPLHLMCSFRFTLTTSKCFSSRINQEKLVCLFGFPWRKLHEFSTWIHFRHKLRFKHCQISIFIIKT